MKANLPFKYIISVKNGKNYVVFDFKDNNKCKSKWVTTGLSEKCAKKILNDKVEEIVTKFYEDYLAGNIRKSENKNQGNFSSPTVSEVGTAAEIADMKFSEYLCCWYNVVKATFAYNTAIAYERSCRLIITYFNRKFPDIKLKDLNALHIQQYYNDLYSEGRKGRTIRSYHALLHSAFNYAVKMDILLVNPTEKAELPRKEKFEATFYTKEKLEKLFEAFKGDRLELVVHIAAYYGLRRGEILGLNWDSIDFDKKTITIRRKVSGSYMNSSGGKIHIENELKTAASVRTFPLIPHIEQMLKERKELEEYYSGLLGRDFYRTYDGFVCRDNTGQLITPCYTSKHFKKIVDRNGLRHIRFHDLRHSCASLLVANGVPMKVIQAWLGHLTYSTTANYYSHLDFNSKIESAETIARLLDGKNNSGEDK